MGARRNRLALVLLFAALLSLAVSVASTQRYEDFSTPTPLPEGDYLILGFQGGVRAWDDESEGVRRLALNLRAARLPGVHVETVENARRDLALQLVRNALNRDRDGQLDPQERASARVILYGQSFGGAAVVKLARELMALEVPVLLTVQVDSVGLGDALIPSNVACAANLYQRNGLIIRGEPLVRAEDPARTRVIGNFRHEYRNKKIDLSQVSWLKKIFRTAHTKINFDPAVWARVEGMILHVLRTGTCNETPAQHD